MKQKMMKLSPVLYLLILMGCSNKINESSSGKEINKAELVNGGVIVYETNGHGLIVAATDIGKHDWANAMLACDQLELNGYNDWRLPTKSELDTLYAILKLHDKGDFENNSYWSSSEFNSYYAYRKNFKTGKIDRHGNKTKEQLVRAVRDF